MVWTPLHVALGEPPASLSFDLVLRACEQRIAESTGLDWKRQLPLTAPRDQRPAREAQQMELAKDIAAMANSGGGMIIYGVAEQRVAGTSAADTVIPVGATDETDAQRIRQVGGNLVYPPVRGLDVIPLAPKGAPEAGVLALIVPDSPDRPHLVHPSKGADWFGAPYRHGPDTEWMVERQLASAYLERDAGRRRRAEDFEARFTDLTRALPQTSDLRWVVALAVPDQPLSRPRDLNPMKANGILERAWSSPIPRGFGPRDLTTDQPTRRGLQRFTREGSRQLGGTLPPVARARVELHGDGAVAVAFTRDGGFPREGKQQTQVAIADMEQAALGFLALLLQARSDLGVTGDFTARLTVHPPTEIFRRLDPTTDGGYAPWDGQRVYGFRPVDGPVIGTSDRMQVIESWLDIVADAVHQTGSGCVLSPSSIATELWLEE